MILPQRIEQLKHEYTDQYVVVEGARPELARFRGMTGRVKTINMSGRALVQFDGANDAAWYDIKLDYLKVVDRPEPKPAPAAAVKPPAKKADKPPEPARELKPSPLELARKEKEEQKEKTEAQAATEKEAGPSSPAEQTGPGRPNTPRDSLDP